MERDYLDEAVELRKKEDPLFERQWRIALAVRPLVALRLGSKLSLREVASRMKTSTSVVQRIENRPWTASMERLFAYADAIGAKLELAAEPRGKQAA